MRYGSISRMPIQPQNDSICIGYYFLICYLRVKMPNQSNHNPWMDALEAQVKKTCFCKLREVCDDKNSATCMKHRNIFAEFMLSKEKRS